MALLLDIEFPGVTAEQYDSVDTAVGTRAAQPPAGLLFHAAVISDAGLRVTDLWDSAASLDAFMARLLPVLKEAGFPEGPTPKTTGVHYYYPR